MTPEEQNYLAQKRETKAWRWLAFFCGTLVGSFGTLIILILLLIAQNLRMK